MKKLALLFTLLLTLFALAACDSAATTTDDTGASVTTPPNASSAATSTAISTTTPASDTASSTTVPSTGTETPSAFFSLEAKDMAEALLADVDTGLTLITETIPLPFSSSETEIFRYHFFTDPVGVKEVAFSQPVISNIPFFLGILKTSTASEAEALAKAINENVNYTKLICAMFQKHYVKVYGNTVFLIMDIEPTRADAVHAALTSLAAS